MTSPMTLFPRNRHAIVRNTLPKTVIFYQKPNKLVGLLTGASCFINKKSDTKFIPRHATGAGIGPNGSYQL